MKIPFASRFKIKEKQIQLTYLTQANLGPITEYIIKEMLVVKRGINYFRRYDDSPNYTEIIFDIPLKTDEYSVSIIPTEATNGNLGNYWISNKTINGFRVYISGIVTTKFDWLVFVKDLNFFEG